jgi:ribosomal protein S18 acetylase RimI-like enzyme
MDNIIIKPATYPERQWAAILLSESEPWLTLGIRHEPCLKVCHDPEFQIYIAHIDHNPCGVIIMDPRGMAGSPYIKSVVVDPGYRNRKIGAAMLRRKMSSVARPGLFFCAFHPLTPGHRNFMGPMDSYRLGN